jgi:quercetin dioxygenase-like cupin family protein
MVTIVSPKHSFSYNGAQINVYHANKGEGLPMHSHAYSHATTCMNGSCKLTQENKSIVIDKNSTPVNLLGGKLHEIEAIEDQTVFVNVFAQGKQ